MNLIKGLAAISLVAGIALFSGAAHADVNCSAPGKTIQSAVNSAKSGDTIFIFGGTCVEDVTITTDDITLSGNGTRETHPFIFFDIGLFAADASSVLSLGNTYKDNQYAAIDIDRQSSFRNGAFLPREAGHPADPNDRDFITQRGCNPDGTGCFPGAVAIEIFNGGSVDLRNADVNGLMEVTGLSSFRVDGDADIQGNILNNANSVARLRDRSFLGDREVTFTGTLTCDASSVSYFSDVQCGQTCSGAIPGSCTP